MDNIPQQLVEGANLSLQYKVLLLCILLPLLCDLQCRHQLSIFCVELLQQVARLGVLRQLKTRETGSGKRNAADVMWSGRLRGN